VRLWRRKSTLIAVLSLTGIVTHLVLRFGFEAKTSTQHLPLLITLVIGGVPMLYDLLRKLLKREFGSDLLGGVSIITSVLLGEYLAGSIIVLMLAGGEALESYALRSASSVLAALAKRMPSIAHRKTGADIADAALAEIAVGDTLVIYPHEICPADGEVTEGHGVMDESYLTGEPFQITKTTGSPVISGAINGETALTIRTTKLAADSRYAKIMEVMRESESKRPQLQRLGDQLGAIYTPVALAVALLAWFLSGDSLRFLAVLVIATPCPLLLGIPIAIISSISLCARRAIIVKSPVVLEQIAGCRTAIFDKTGTLTYGEPALTEQLMATGFDQKEMLSLVASLEATRSIRSHAPSSPQQRRKASPCQKPTPSASSPAKVWSAPCLVINSRSPVATNSSRRICPAPISSRPSLVDSNASSSSTATTPPPCVFAMPRVPKAAAS
jgi:P-type E1-E2 ATPase